MSSEITILNTADINSKSTIKDRIYIETNGGLIDGCKTEYCMVIDFSDLHSFEINNDGTLSVYIEEGTDLYNKMHRLKKWN